MTVDRSREGSYGLVRWELVEVSTGRVRRGHKELLLTDFEVVVLPPPPPPRYGLLRSSPRQTIADAIGWLVRGGRGSTTKRARLEHGFWLVLRERRSPARTSLILLSARRDEQRLAGMEWFRVDEDGATASQVDASGALHLEWTQDGEGFEELASLATVTDVSLDLRTARGPSGRPPVWRVSVLAGSTIRWPRSADGVRLVPRLRPSLGGD